MAKNIDSFDMDKWSKGKKEKAEKPVKEKKEKETSFDMDDSTSFNVEKFEKKPKKEKAEKPIKEEKETSFEIKSKKEKSFDVAEKGKKTKEAKEKKIKESEDFAIDDSDGKKKKFDLKDKKTRKKFIILVICSVLLLAGIIVGIVLFVNHGKKIAKIEIISEPIKLEYKVGDEPDYTGLVVKATRNNGKTLILRANDCVIEGFGSELAAENQIITVNYGGCIDIFSVKIIEEIKPAPILTGIRLDPMPKTEYKVGEKLDVNGVYVVREYLDGSTVKVNLLKTDVEGWRDAYYGGPGTYTLRVSYEENGVTVYTSFDITITE